MGFLHSQGRNSGSITPLDPAMCLWVQACQIDLGLFYWQGTERQEVWRMTPKSCAPSTPTVHIAICLSFLHWVHANCLHLLVLSFSSSPVLMQFDCMHLKTYTVWFIYSNFYNQFCNHDSGSGIGKNMFIDTRQPPPRRPPPPPPPREGATLCQICTCTCTYIQI